MGFGSSGPGVVFEELVEFGEVFVSGGVASPKVFPGVAVEVVCGVVVAVVEEFEDGEQVEGAGDDGGASECEGVVGCLAEGEDCSGSFGLWVFDAVGFVED